MNPYLDIMLRSAAVYLFIILAIRLFGKRELSQLSVIDLVFILLISNSVQNAMVGPSTSLWGGLLAAGSLFLLNYLLRLILYRNNKINTFLQGSPVMLVQHGVVIPENMKSERISIEELEAAAREHGVDSIRHIDLAVVETDGSISILSDNYLKKTIRHRKAHKAITKTN